LRKLLRLFIPSWSSTSHNIIVDIVIVDLRAIVNGRIGDVTADVIDNISHYFAVLLCNCGSLLNHFF